MPRGMVATVGSGTKDRIDTLLRAIEQSIEGVRPDVLSLVYSESTKENADHIHNSLTFQPKFIPWQLTDPNNPDAIFQECSELIHQLCDDYQCSPNLIWLDFTSGTKAMSAGLVLAGAAMNIENYRYITGPRKDGIVQPGMEEFRDMSLARFIADQELNRAKENLRNLRYHTARHGLQNINVYALPPRQQTTIQALNTLCSAFEAWDLFHHRTAFDQFKSLKDIPDDLSEFQIAPSLLQVLQNLANTLDPQKKPYKTRYTPEALADLYNNAVRRLWEGKYDDACARFYRLTEMAAQLALQEQGIDTSRVTREQLSNVISQEQLEKYIFFPSRYDDVPTARLGLDMSYTLLKDIGQPLGKKKEELKSFTEILDKRNKSILAHGVSPVDRSTCEAFQSCVLELIESQHPNFAELAKKLQFPWLAC